MLHGDLHCFQSDNCVAKLFSHANTKVVTQEERHDHSAIRLPIIAHLILIHIGVEQLLVAAVDDSRAVADSKDMVHSIALEGLEGDGLAAQAQLLPLTQFTCTSTFEHEQGQEAHMATQLWHADCISGQAVCPACFCWSSHSCNYRVCILL